MGVSQRYMASVMVAIFEVCLDGGIYGLEFSTAHCCSCLADVPFMEGLV
jgi:hypothetical protein